MGEVLFIIAMFLPTVLMGILKMWPLFWVFCIFDICFGLTEWLYVSRTGRTVSQHFWEYAKKKKVKAMAILASMGIMWTALLLHLGYKMFR
jgi:undecaprenyl pyrophosphate phosphatase UppP